MTPADTLITLVLDECNKVQLNSMNESMVFSTVGDPRMFTQAGRLSLAHIPVDGPRGTSHHDIVDYAGRKVVAVRMGDTHIPFYCSTGSCPKDGVYPGRWYPTLGMSHAWVNKVDEIKDYYGHPKLKEAGEELDRILGDMRGVKENPLWKMPIPSLKTERRNTSHPEYLDPNPVAKYPASYEFLNHAFGGTHRIVSHPWQKGAIDTVKGNIEKLTHLADNLDITPKL